MITDQTKNVAEQPVPAELANYPIVDVRPVFARGGTPCEVIDAAVERTGAGESFTLLVPFEPVPLYTKLRNQGFTHQTSREEDGSVKVVFKRS